MKHPLCAAVALLLSACNINFESPVGDGIFGYDWKARFECGDSAYTTFHEGVLTTVGDWKCYLDGPYTREDGGEQAEVHCELGAVAADVVTGCSPNGHHESGAVLFVHNSDKTECAISLACGITGDI